MPNQSANYGPLTSVFALLSKYLSSQHLLRYGDEGTRTPDLLRAKEALSHLSYIPFKVGLTRLELVTSPLSEERSNQLSYRPT